MPNEATSRRYPIAFDRWYSLVSTCVGILPSRSWIEIAGAVVEVRMSWAFQARFSTSDVQSAVVSDERPMSRGVHGMSGRWLVNGAAAPLVSVRLRPGCAGRVMGVPVRLEELLVSVDDAFGLSRALRPAGAMAPGAQPPPVAAAP